ncbi:hypothetical protein SAMN05661010_02108 [Modicisalibacter muralis]|uniref:Uncharacterized protein n=1 Tax=Modicisalibacter muralis TaxID=119000 RepID=A0A1G9LIR2_9GAMM|nr:hypothetical protein [Halomonas muralis]SDL61757.1 hypothetical protein SAMN05661010_02108 [Halomonas muralis]
MEPQSFRLDRRLHELLMQECLSIFTVRQLRDAYYEGLSTPSCSRSELRRYLYQQVLRLKKAGWIVVGEERVKRDQCFHVREKPERLRLKLIDRPFESKPENAENSQPASGPLETPAACSKVAEQLNYRWKEMRLELLASIGEAEQFKMLFQEFPNLEARLNPSYLESRDRSSKLLGQIKALETTMQALTEHSR